MTIIVGDTERAELKAAMARARAHPLPWEVLRRRITEQDGTNTGHVEDQPLAHERPPAEFVDLPFGYIVAMCAMIFSALDVPAEADDVWTEELLIDGKPGGRTFNVVWLVEPAI